MKRCIKAHHVDAFGDIPVGSLWADDSPYIEVPANFVDADKPATKSTTKLAKES
jgi:hypothetical protein